MSTKLDSEIRAELKNVGFWFTFRDINGGFLLGEMTPPKKVHKMKISNKKQHNKQSTKQNKASD